MKRIAWVLTGPPRARLDPLVPDHLELHPVFLVEMLRAGVAEAGEVEEELFGVLRDLLARGAAERDRRGVAVVFGAGQPQGFLAGVLPHHAGEALVEHPHRVAADLRRLAVAPQGVAEVAELLLPAQVRV